MGKLRPRAQRPARSLAERLEGWEVGAIVVLIVALVSAVIVPRTAIPEDIPAPNISQRELDAARARNDRLVAIATDAELSPDVRLVGAQIRLLGRAEYSEDDAGASKALATLGKSVPAALEKHGDEMAALQTYQADRFAKSYASFLRVGRVSDDLIDLGGAALAEFRRNEWLTSLAEAPRDLDLILSAMFKRRFRAVIAPRHPRLAPDPVEERALVGFLLKHPPPASVPGTRREKKASRGDYLLKRIDELADLEPDYPALYAKGIVFYRMQQFEAAAAAFDEYLQRVGNGPYRLRAINYMKAAIENSEGSPDLVEP